MCIYFSIVMKSTIELSLLYELLPAQEQMYVDIMMHFALTSFRGHCQLKSDKVAVLSLAARST